MTMIDPNCAFCRIVQGWESARIVCETDAAVAFLPLEPAIFGHTLVVPRVHVPDLWNIDEVLACRVMQAAVRVSKAVRLAVDPDGLNLINSAGEAASQTVWHLHIHVVPRWHNDRIGRIWPPESAYSDAVKDEMAERIRGAWYQ